MKEMEKLEWMLLTHSMLQHQIPTGIERLLNPPFELSPAQRAMLEEPIISFICNETVTCDEAELSVDWYHGAQKQFMQGVINYTTEHPITCSAITKSYYHYTQIFHVTGIKGIAPDHVEVLYTPMFDTWKLTGE